MSFLLPWRKSPPLPHCQLGVGWYHNGIRLVKLSHINDATPTLDFYKSLPYKYPITLHKFVKRLSLQRLPCVGVIDIGNYQLLLTEPPPVLDSELLAAVRWQIQELVDFNIEDAIIDVFDEPTPANQQPKKMIYVVAAPKEVVQTDCDNLLGAGFKLIALDIPELVLRNIAALLPEDKYGVALLWLTPKHGMLTITRRATLYLSRTVEAEGKLKQLLPLMIKEIRRSFTYYENHFNQAPINYLVIAPMSPPLPNLCQYLSTHLKINVRLLDLNKLFYSERHLSAVEQAQYFPMLGAALRVE
jgi:MSHA biogenesis protein MshI